MSASDPKETFPTRARVESLAERYSLALPNAVHSPRSGEMSGRRTGSSVEYQDRKDFAPGDDLRHVDWRGFARSDRMTVKLYREEIMPRVDIIIDGSASMEVTPEKRLRRLEMVYLFWMLGRRLHGQITCWLAGNGSLRPLSHPLDIMKFSASRFENPLTTMRGSPVSRPGGIRVFVTDLLFPFEPSQLDAALGRCDRLIVTQVLSAFEENPGEGMTGGGMVRLMNAETDEYLDVRLDADTVTMYRKRLRAIQSDMSERLRMRGGAFVTMRDNEPLDTACRNMHSAGILAI